MQKYKRGAKIAQGAFGTVYEVRLQENPSKRYAMKQIFSGSQNVERQLSLLKSIPSHQNLIHTHQVIRGKLCTNVIMEYGEFDILKWLLSNQYPILQQNQTLIKLIAKDILQGLEHLHSNGIIHRDLKPSNVLVKQGGTMLMICDLGSAVRCHEGREEYQIEGFTRWYKPPEMMFGDRRYAYQVDIWSLGCLLMEVATGEPFFAGRSELEQLALIANCLGSPTPDNWPLVVNLPDHGKINFKQRVPQTLQTICQQRAISIQLGEFIMKMVRYQDRRTAKQLLKDEFLSEVTNSEIDSWKKYKLQLGNLKTKLKDSEK